MLETLQGDAAGLAAPPPAAVRSLAEYRYRPTRRELTARVGMAIFLGSWVMLFAGLMAAYLLVRARADFWPPPDQPRLPVVLPGINTAVIVASSAALAAAQRALRAGQARAGSRRIALSALLGVLFLCLQLAVWSSLWRAGLVPAGGPYPSAFYALTTLHGLHVAVGLVALGALAVRAHAGRAARMALDLWAMYWHAVGAVWLVIYVSVYRW